MTKSYIRIVTLSSVLISSSIVIVAVLCATTNDADSSHTDYAQSQSEEAYDHSNSNTDRKEYIRRHNKRLNTFSNIINDISDDSSDNDESSVRHSKRNIDEEDIALGKRDESYRLQRRNEVISFLDEFIRSEGYDKEWSEQRINNVASEIGDRSDIGDPHLLSTECGRSMCRIEVRFDNQYKLREFVIAIRSIKALRSPAFWLVNMEDSNNGLLIYMARKGRSFPKLPEELVGVK